LAGFLDDKSTLDAISRVVYERTGGASRLTAGRVIVHKNWQNTSSPKYNDDISLVIWQYLISGWNV
jgi:hypothetical protein